MRLAHRADMTTNNDHLHTVTARNPAHLAILPTRREANGEKRDEMQHSRT